MVNQLWIWLNKLLLLLLSGSCPPSSTSRNTTARHTDFSVFTSQHLLYRTIFLPSCLYYACSVTSFFSVRLFFKLVYGKRCSVREAWLSTFNASIIGCGAFVLWEARFTIYLYSCYVLSLVCCYLYVLEGAHHQHHRHAWSCRLHHRGGALPPSPGCSRPGLVCSGRGPEPDVDGEPADEPIQGAMYSLHQQAGQGRGQPRQGHLTDEVRDVKWTRHQVNILSHASHIEGHCSLYLCNWQVV